MFHNNFIIVYNRNIWQSSSCCKVLNTFKIVDNSFYFCPQTFSKFLYIWTSWGLSKFHEKCICFKVHFDLKKIIHQYYSFSFNKNNNFYRCPFLISLNSWSEHFSLHRSSPLLFMVTGPCVTFILIFWEMHSIKNLEICSFIIYTVIRILL